MKNRLSVCNGGGREDVRTTSHIFNIFILAFLSFSCLACNNSATTSKAIEWVSTEIYFGSNIPNGGDVSEQQFAEFLSNEVSPAFPAGLTAYDAYGQMQNSNGVIVKQKTKVVLLVHEKSKANDDSIRKIVTLYKSRFGNPQVMLITKPVTPEFYGN